jgi:hypothetical protein
MIAAVAGPPAPVTLEVAGSTAGELGQG